MLALPAATPDTCPLGLTLAVVPALELHDTATFVMGAPPASRASAVSCVLRPTARRFPIGEVTTIDATVGGASPLSDEHAMRLATATTLAKRMVVGPGGEPNLPLHRGVGKPPPELLLGLELRVVLAQERPDLVGQPEQLGPLLLVERDR